MSDSIKNYLAKKKGVKKAKQIDLNRQIYDQISYSFIKI